ncbi:MAG TPA: AI-2E family transporter, partial [Phycisphaerae bacterium]
MSDKIVDNAADKTVGAVCGARENAAPGIAPPAPGALVITPPPSYTQKVMIAVGISLAAILLAAFIYNTSQILVLLFAGLLLAVFLSAPADLLAKHTRIQRTYALGMVLMALFVVVAGGGYFMGFTITRQVQSLTQTLPGALKQAETDLEHRFAPPPPPTPPTAASAPASATGAAASEPVFIGVTTAASPATENSPHNWIADKLIEVRQAATDFLFSETFVKHAGGVAGGVVSSTFGILGNIAIVVGVGLFFALNPKLYSRGIIKLAPISRRNRAAEILGEVRTQLQWWFVGQMCSMVSIAALTFIGLWILGVPMAITLAILAGLMTLIPNFGPIIAGVPAVLIAFAPQGDQTVLNPARAGWVIVVYIVIQMMDGWVITPFVQQR